MSNGQYRRRHTDSCFARIHTVVWVALGTFSTCFIQRNEAEKWCSEKLNILIKIFDRSFFPSRHIGLLIIWFTTFNLCNCFRLVRMRNPWGHFSWNGDWSDMSDIWTPELRDLLLTPGGDDGVFWIAFEDVLKYFDCIDICKVRKGWSEVRLSGTLPPFSSKQHQTATLLTVLEPTEVEFSLFQEGQR